MTIAGNTNPMPKAELREWIELRGVPQIVLDEITDRFYGKTEAEMEAIYDDEQGSMA